VQQEMKSPLSPLRKGGDVMASPWLKGKTTIVPPHSAMKSIKGRRILSPIAMGYGEVRDLEYMCREELHANPRSPLCEGGTEGISPPRVPPPPSSRKVRHSNAIRARKLALSGP
jgi:hypothetical protein